MGNGEETKDGGELKTYLEVMAKNLLRTTVPGIGQCGRDLSGAVAAALLLAPRNRG